MKTQVSTASSPNARLRHWLITLESTHLLGIGKVLFAVLQRDFNQGLKAFWTVWFLYTYPPYANKIAPGGMA